MHKTEDAKYVEMVVPGNDMKAFVCESRKDLQLFLSEVYFLMLTSFCIHIMALYFMMLMSFVLPSILLINSAYVLYSLYTVLYLRSF